MREKIAIVIGLAFTTGCTRGAAQTTMALGGVAMVGGIAVAVGSEPGNNDVVPAGPVFGGGLAVLGLILVLGGAVGLGTSPPEAEPDPVVITADQRRRELADLTAGANAAARVGQCEIVKALDTRILSLDREAHVRSFLANRLIRACLATR